MKSLYNIIALIFTTLILSCDPKSPHPDSSTPTASIKMNNVRYSNNDSRNVLDIYLPAHRSTSTPFVILIHGGGWSSGDKTDFKALQDSFFNRGIASASINYKYASSTNHYEGLMSDVNNALSYIKSKATEWNIRNTNYAIGGISAGAHMSMLYAYKYDTAGHIAAVINACGPTDITYRDWLNYGVLIGQIGIVNNMVGATYNAFEDLHPRFSYASPIVGIKNVPTLTLHGTADPTVYYEHAVKLKNEFNNKGFENKLVPLEGAGHDLGVANPATLNLILNEMEWWIKNKT